MTEQTPAEITRILQDWNDGDEGAKERLVPFVYDELKRNRRPSGRRGMRVGLPRPKV